MLIAEFNPDKHYSQLCDLWKEHNWCPCPLDAIPKESYIAKNNGSILAFMAMYVDEKTIAVIDWAVSNKIYPKEIRAYALKTLFEYLVERAKKKGCNYIYSFTGNKKWGQKMESYGMRLAEQDAATYIMPLNNGDVSFISD